jgi:hypothetical protein
MELYKVFGIVLIFLLGFFSANIVGVYLSYGLEKPFFNNLGFSKAGLNSNSAPFDFIKENQIEVYGDKIVIKVNNASLSRYAATGSMKPVFDENANGIRIVPISEKDIHIGDIISYESNGSLIVHRIVEKSSDEEGTYFITKGDNNIINDGKIRFKDIKYVTIGVLW